MAPFKFSGSRHPIVIVVDDTSNTVKFSGLLGTIKRRENRKETKRHNEIDVNYLKANACDRMYGKTIDVRKRIRLFFG